MSVSRKGGYVVRALSQRAPVRSAITVDAALERPRNSSPRSGCRGMKESYHILKDHVLTVTYCAEQNGVMCYPDMVKLAVAMDTGEMLRFDAEAYLTSHAERDLPEPAVSEEDARAMAGEGLTVQSEKLARHPDVRRGGDLLPRAHLRNGGRAALSSLCERDDRRAGEDFDPSRGRERHARTLKPPQNSGKT